MLSIFVLFTGFSNVLRHSWMLPKWHSIRIYSSGNTKSNGRKKWTRSLRQLFQYYQSTSFLGYGNSQSRMLLWMHPRRTHHGENRTEKSFTLLNESVVLFGLSTYFPCKSHCINLLGKVCTVFKMSMQVLNFLNRHKNALVEK